MIDLNTLERRFHSQNGEDGILEFLISRLAEPTGRLVEIGAAEGIENNSTHHIKNGHEAVLIEGDQDKAAKLKQFLATLSPSQPIKILNGFVTARNIAGLAGAHFPESPDFLSLDVDGIDAYVLDALLETGFKPSILCVEYNSFLSPRPVTVVYDEAFNRYRYHPNFGLYYGASVEGLTLIAARYGYRFLCVDRTGTNAFFALPERFTQDLDALTGLSFQYTTVFCRKYRRTGEQLAEALSRTGLEFVGIDETFRGNAIQPPR